MHNNVSVLIEFHLQPRDSQEVGLPKPKHDLVMARYVVEFKTADGVALAISMPLEKPACARQYL
jgi:hypothetical protein